MKTFFPNLPYFEGNKIIKYYVGEN
jgi:hypothetical protein